MFAIIKLNQKNIEKNGKYMEEILIMMATRFRSGIMILMAILATGCQMQETVETAPTQVEAKGVEDTVSEKEVSEGNATNDKTQQEPQDRVSDRQEDRNLRI